jgi:hypothetical protein
MGREFYDSQKGPFGFKWHSPDQIENMIRADKIAHYPAELERLRKLPVKEMYQEVRQSGPGYHEILDVVEPGFPHLRRGLSDRNNKIMDNIEIEAHFRENNAVGRHLGIVAGGFAGMVGAFLTLSNPFIALGCMVGGIIGGGLIGDRIEHMVKKHLSPEQKKALIGYDIGTAAMTKMG